jgi:hypothetical protein
VKLIAFVAEFWGSISGKSDADDLAPRRPRATCDKERKNTFTSNQTKWFHRA